MSAHAAGLVAGKRLGAIACPAIEVGVRLLLVEGPAVSAENGVGLFVYKFKILVYLSLSLPTCLGVRETYGRRACGSSTRGCRA